VHHYSYSSYRVDTEGFLTITLFRDNGQGAVLGVCEQQAVTVHGALYNSIIYDTMDSDSASFETPQTVATDYNQTTITRV